MNMIGRKIFNSISGVGSFTFLLTQTLKDSFRKFPSWSLILDQFYSIGILSLPVVAITGFSTGCVLAAQSFFQLTDKGLEGITGLFVGKSMLTEVGPVLTAFMITGRVGSSMCAVIGTMKVTEQIDALKSMAVSPLSYLVTPRILGSIVMVPLLTLFSAIMGIYGGYLIATYVFGMSPQDYFDPMPANISPFDICVGLIKGFFFGFFISAISCYKGLTTRGGAVGVGKSTTNSVVIIYSMILIFNFLLTIALNVSHNSYVENFE